MKKFLIVAGLLTVIATPAFAQSFDPDEGTGNALPFSYGTQMQRGNDAYAQTPKEIEAIRKSDDAAQTPADNITKGAGALREFRD